MEENEVQVVMADELGGAFICMCKLTLAISDARFVHWLSWSTWRWIGGVGPFACVHGKWIRIALLPSACSPAWY